MEMDEKRIREIVSQVVSGIKEADQRPAETPSAPSAAPATAPTAVAPGEDGVFDEIDAAIDAARQAQGALVAFGMSKRFEIVEAMRKAALDSSRSMAEKARAETKMGDVEDKVLKNEYTAKLTPGPEVLRTDAITGDEGCTLIERGPFGVILAVTPSTNPTSTVTNNGIMMVSAGNGVFFSPHPGARECTLEQMQVLNRAIVAAGGPPNLMTGVAESSLRTVVQAMKHPNIDLISATGGAAVVRAALESGKPSVCAGPGNPPALVDETADIAKAAEHIIRGGTYDNNLPCIDEKTVVVVEAVADRLIEAMERNNTYIATEAEADRIVEACIQDDSPTRDLIGQEATAILERAGVAAPANTKCVVLDHRPEDCPIVQHEQMMPVLPVLRAPDFESGVELAIRTEHGFKHTAAIHSTSIDHITHFARAIDTTVFVANAPAYAWVGVGAEGWLSQTIAGPKGGGGGVTDARTWTRQRMIAFGGSLRVV